MIIMRVRHAFLRHRHIWRACEALQHYNGQEERSKEVFHSLPGGHLTIVKAERVVRERYLLMLFLLQDSSTSFITKLQENLPRQRLPTPLCFRGSRSITTTLHHYYSTDSDAVLRILQACRGLQNLQNFNYFRFKQRDAEANRS